MRLAVIGTGISGMGAAWLLHRSHELVVYEQAHRIGGHTNTIQVAGPDGPVPVDTGFIVYNERNYPRLSALFRMLDIPTRPSDMSFSASLNDGRIEWAGDALFAQRSNLISLTHWRMLSDIVKFNRAAKEARHDPALETVSIGEFLRAGSYGDELVHRYLLPMAAAIWSCPPSSMMSFPAAALMRFFDNHGLLDLTDRPQWRTVVGGSATYMAALTSAWSGAIRTGTGAAAIERRESGVRVRDVHGQWAEYDGVVVATHADQALAMLTDADTMERELLSPFSYQPNTAVLHSDVSLMPRRRSAWSSWNYLSGVERSVSVTYWMNRLQGLGGKQDYFVSLNPLKTPAQALVHHTVDYSHPVFDTAAMQAQRFLGELQGRRNTWFCGSYFGYGFHEDGFSSAVDAVLAMGEDVPAELHNSRSRAVAHGS